MKKWLTLFLSRSNCRILIFSILIISLSQPLQATTLKGGAFSGAYTNVQPVIAYSFDEGTSSTINDSSINSYNGTLNGTIDGSTWVNGQYGKALYFNGIDNYISFSSPSNLAAITNLGPYTITMWIKRDVTTNPLEKAVLSKSDNNDNKGFWVAFRHSDKICLDDVHSANNTKRCVNFSTGAWTHVALTYNAEWATDTSPTGAAITIYINGSAAVVQIDQPAVGTKLSDITREFFIGKSDNVALEFFDGYLDNVRIYRKVLTSAEITADMNSPVILGN